MDIQTQAWVHTDTSMSLNRDKYPCTCAHLGMVQAHMLHRTAHIDLHTQEHPGLFRQEYGAATISDVGRHTYRHAARPECVCLCTRVCYTGVGTHVHIQC